MIRPLVLCYHAVSQDWPAPLSVTPAALRGQLTALRRRGYMGVTFSDVAHGRARGKVVAVTFDDAFASVDALARPILDDLALPATVFAPTAHVGRPDPMSWPGIDQWLDGPHEHELACMDWNQLRALRDHGWEIGSHTRTHPFLTRIDDETLDAELARSKADCERELGRCDSLAYPYGDYDERVVEKARAAGYATACTLPQTMHTGRPLAWPRIGIYQADDRLRFMLKTVPAVQRLRANPALASAVRRLSAARD